MNAPLAASLFSGAGIGDLGLKAAGFNFTAMCELEHDRAALCRLNFPEAVVFAEDVTEVGPSFVAAVRSAEQRTGQELFLVTCTAPCQGMSKSGQGTLLKNIREGRRPKLDPRNRLILPALKIIAELRPRWVIFENVIEMRGTWIEDEAGELRPILEIIASSLGTDYLGQAYDVEFADHGIPQRRQRLITVYTREEAAKGNYERGYALVPSATHAKRPIRGLKRWISVAEALSGFPSLDAKNAEAAASATIPFHRVPVLDPKKYEWIRHTPRGASAFDNQCINTACGFTGNTTHGNKRTPDGINRASVTTPLHCQACGEMLPRPYTADPDGTKRIMAGFTSAYKRMDPDLPAPALTRNLSYPCSDHKVHPTENRVLSLAEAMHLQTISQFEYRWGPIGLAIRGKEVVREQAPDTLIRLVIGESVPPKFLQLLGLHIRSLSQADPLGAGLNTVPHETRLQLSLI
jgi:DNA (cytosine-5)-methyltransferase 1